MGFQRELAPFGRGQGGNAPLSPSAEGEIPLAVKNGERGEETDRFPRGSDQERFPLYSLRKIISSKRSSGTF